MSLLASVNIKEEQWIVKLDILLGLKSKMTIAYLKACNRFIELPREVSVEIDVVCIVSPCSVVVALTLPDGDCHKRS